MEGLEALIPVINKLQDVFNTIGAESIQLPQIVVVGTQVLWEGTSYHVALASSQGGLWCFSFFHTNHPAPEAKRKNGKSGHKEWAQFLGEERIYTDFSAVRAKIEHDTDSVAGTKKGIESVPINLKIFSPNVVNLTLVDLPGLTKVAVGDQPKDIEHRIQSLILDYIRNPNSLILAVTPANTDMACSDALKLAKAVDPEGRRTLAVITKLDLMDKGTDAQDVLSGQVIPVKLGIVGVVNRSQQDIIDEKSIQACLADEATFLHNSYHTVAHQHGTRYLSTKLNDLLMHHIRDRLPDVKERVNKKITDNQALLDSLGEPFIDKDKALVQLVLEFADAYHETISGTSKNVDSRELRGGAKICSNIFYDQFDKQLTEVEPMDGLSTQDIVFALRNAAGLNPALFVPEPAFRDLVKTQIRRLEKPCLQCTDAVRDEMQHVVQHCGKAIENKMSRFPKLYEQIIGIMNSLLTDRYTTTSAKVKELIQMETAFINTKHPDFRDVAKDLLEPNEEEKKAQEKKKADESHLQYMYGATTNTHTVNVQGQPNRTLGKTSGQADFLKAPELDLSTLAERELNDCTLIQTLIEKYFLIVRQTIQDLVPKAIVCFMIEDIKNAVRTELMAKLYRSENFDILLNESKGIVDRRKKATTMFEALHQASRIINEVRDSSFT